MVCDRCKLVLQKGLEDAGVKVVQMKLGEVVVEDHNLNSEELKQVFGRHGFELVSAPDSVLCEKIKAQLIRIAAELPLDPGVKLSELISREIGRDYSSLSRSFSRHEGITIEKYFLQLKIEKAKELIQLGQHSFTEIAYLLDYSGINHLSRHFKQSTGLSMSEFREDQSQPRKSLDKIV